MKAVILVEVRPQKIIQGVIDALQKEKNDGVKRSIFEVTGRYDLIIYAEYDDPAALTKLVLSTQRITTKGQVATETFQVLQEH